MVTSLKHDILLQANQLCNQFTREKEHIDQLSPRSQMNATSQLQEDILAFETLQQKIANIARGQIQIDPGFRDEEMNTLQEKMATSVKCLESILNNSVIATNYYEEIWPQIAELRHDPNLTSAKIASLQERIESIIKNHAHLINPANKHALDLANLALQALTCNPPNAIPDQYDSTSANQRIRQEQDENYRASLFVNQYQEILKRIGNSPVQDFEIFFEYYEHIKEYSQSKTSYLSQEAKSTIATYVQLSEEALGKIIQAQATHEQQHVQQIQSQAAVGHALNELLEAVKQTRDAQTQNVDIESYLTRINKAFRKLSLKEKQDLFNAINEILKEQQSPRVLGPATLGQDFKYWHATLTIKEQAIEKILPALRVPTAPVIEHAEEMNRRFLAVKNSQPVSVPTTPQSQSNHSPQPSLPNDDSNFIFIGDKENTPPLNPLVPTLPARQSRLTEPQDETAFPYGRYAGMYVGDDDDISTLGFAETPGFDEPPSAPLTINNAPSSSDVQPNVIPDLQAILVLLGLQRPSGELEEACLALHILDSKGYKSVFKISDLKPRLIAERPFYHLYFIHKNESPEKLNDDMQYGNKAFAGVYPATNAERSRAVQRTIVELALENLEDAINFGDGETLIQLLAALEEIKLDPKDRAGGHENAAYNLFNAFYHLHANARVHNSSLRNPDLRQFEGDFGRIAFGKIMDGIDPAIKIAAINKVRSDLKAAWKLQ